MKRNLRIVSVFGVALSIVCSRHALADSHRLQIVNGNLVAIDTIIVKLPRDNYVNKLASWRPILVVTPRSNALADRNGWYVLHAPSNFHNVTTLLHALDDDIRAIDTAPNALVSAPRDPHGSLIYDLDFAWHFDDTEKDGPSAGHQFASVLPALNSVEDPGVAIFDSGVHRNVVKDRAWPAHAPFHFPPSDLGNWSSDIGIDCSGATLKPNFNPAGNHGSHVAAIITKHDGFYVVDCKVVDDRGIVTVDSVLTALAFVHEAKKQPVAGTGSNIRVISMCFGGLRLVNDAQCTSLDQAIQVAQDDQMLIVTSAGNGHESSDLSPRLPSRYSVPTTALQYGNVISVGSVSDVASGTDPFPFSLTSNYGINSVQLCAVGENVPAPIGPGRPLTASGTSAAAADVAGLAGSLFAEPANANLKPVDAKGIILQTVMKPALAINSFTGITVTRLSPLVLTGGVVNSVAALAFDAATLNACQVYVWPGFIVLQPGQSISTFATLEKYGAFALSPLISVESPSVSGLTVAVDSTNPLKINVVATSIVTPGIYHVAVRAVVGRNVLSETGLVVAISGG